MQSYLYLTNQISHIEGICKRANESTERVKVLMERCIGSSWNEIQKQVSSILESLWYKKLIEHSKSLVVTESVKENTSDFYLMPVFQSVMENDKKNFEKYYYPSEIFSFQNRVFPKNLKERKKHSTRADYQIIWSEFEKECINLQSNSLMQLNENLLSLLQKYTTFIPYTTAVTDISYYDYLQFFNGISLSIYEYIVEELGDINQIDSIKEDYPIFLLIGGDLSGIQSFIYDVINKLAGKNLKGRSYYLQLITEWAVQELVVSLGLTQSHIVYVSGGGFYLLAPNTQKIRSEFEIKEKEIHQDLLSVHKMQLYLSLGYTSLTIEDIKEHKINEKWRDLSEKLNAKKRRKYYSLIQESYNTFFEPWGKNTESPIDRITGEEIEGKVIKYEEGEDLTLSEQTSSIIELGKNLVEAKEVHLMRKTLPRDITIKSPFSGWGCKVYNHIPKQQTLSADTLRYIHFHEKVPANFQSLLKWNYSMSQEISSFEDLLASSSLRRLGILRMDVDNLGQIFMRGLSGNQKTLTRLANISRSLDYFFRGYLYLIRERKEFKKYINILYAGGDDLFVLGDWEQVLLFAEQIYKEFKEWVAHNPYFTLSGGIVLVNNKYPILQSANLSHEAEKKSKKHRCKNQEKNAITFLDFPMNWEKEFPKVKELKNKFVNFIQVQKVNKSLITKLMDFYDLKKQQTERNENPQWKWLLAYHIRRMIDQNRNNQDLKLFLEQLQKDCLLNSSKMYSDYDYIDFVGVAARWAELEIRSVN